VLKGREWKCISEAGIALTALLQRGEKAKLISRREVFVGSALNY